MAKMTYRKDYQPYPFEVKKCQLSFEIFADHVLVGSKIEFQQNPRYHEHQAKQVGGFKHAELPNCVLDGMRLEILSLELDGRALTEGVDYRYETHKLELFGTAGKANFCFTAKVKIDPYNNKALEGMYKSGQILCTQNEANGFRNITFYPSRPDVMSRFVTEITADKAQFPQLLSNGNLLESRELAAGRHYARWEDPFAKPAYLYALVAGDLDVLEDSFQTCSGRNIALKIYTDKGRTEQARFAMESLKQAMRWDEQRFGREYDLDLFMIVAVDSFNFGAMENKGLNIFNSSLVFASKDTATDATYESIASVIAHEYFHNWTGNRITCRDWFQLTLKEGLTVYRDELFSEDHFNSEVCRIQKINDLRNSQYPEDSGPNRHPIRPDSFIDINNFYTQTVYQKGAEVIRMMALYLGEEGFRKGMDRYFERFDGQAVTCDDFVDAIEEGGGKDLSLLRRWYEQAGTPHLYVESSWDGREFVLHLRQENPNAAIAGSDLVAQDFPPLAFPLPLALYHPDSGEKLLEDMVLFSERKTQLRYSIEGIKQGKGIEPAKPVPSLLLGHASPVEVHYDYSEAELLLLISADQDSFNRYEAVQKYLQNLLLAQNMGQPSELGQTAKPADKFVAQLRSWLQAQASGSSGALAPRYLSCLLQVPSLQVLGAEQNPPQFQALHQVREAYCWELARQLEIEMLTCYESLAQPHYERSELAVGQRALRNTLLQYLCRLSDQDGKQPHHELAYQQFCNCNNMTDSYAALLTLSYWPGQHSEAALTDFAERWKDDFLVLCRWFALQAGVPIFKSGGTLQKIQQLEQHPLFQPENPNMLRSLYAVLGQNLPVFHQKGGAAYDFLAQRILKIDNFNSMMAAGLAKSFVAYKRLDNDSQQSMSKALNIILEAKGISDRLYEIVSKTLEVTT